MWMFAGLYFFQGKRMRAEGKKHIRDSRSGFLGMIKNPWSASIKEAGTSKKKLFRYASRSRYLTGKRWIPGPVDFQGEIESR